MERHEDGLPPACASRPGVTATPGRRMQTAAYLVNIAGLSSDFFKKPTSALLSEV
jgi:hypothetical protein